MKKRVTHISQGEHQEFEWGSTTWLHSGSFSGSAELTVGEVVIKPGCANPLHTHPNSEEVIYLIEGELDHSCGDEPSYRLTPGSSIAVQRGVLHNAKCVSDCNARMFVAFSTPDRQMKAE